MNRPAKFIFWTVGVIVAIPVLLIVLLPGCKNIVPTTEYAPSGRYMAEAEDYDCGAVSRFETIVMIRQRPFWLSNSFFGRGAHILIFEGPPQRITLQWKKATNVRWSAMDVRNESTRASQSVERSHSPLYVRG